MTIYGITKQAHKNTIMAVRRANPTRYIYFTPVSSEGIPGCFVRRSAAEFVGWNPTVEDLAANDWDVVDDKTKAEIYTQDSIERIGRKSDELIQKVDRIRKPLITLACSEAALCIVLSLLMLLTR